MNEGTSPERIAVVAGRHSVGVTVSLVAAVVTVAAPPATNTATLSQEQARGVALRLTAQALEVALQERRQELAEGGR